MALTLAGTPAINGLTLPTDTFVSGMVLVNKTDFSAASSVSLNNVFTSTYENYRVIIEAVGSMSSVTSVNLRMRANGTDATAGNYARAGYYNATGGSGNLFAANQTTLGIGDCGDLIGAQTFDVLRPYTTYKTGLTVLSSAWGTSTGTGLFMNGLHDSASLYDGFTFYLNSGTFTGTVRVYGMRNT